MKIGIDCRPVVAAPWSGIGRQVAAMSAVLAATAGDQVQGYSGCGEPPLHCPHPPQPRQGMHRPPQRLRFEAGFLPRALAADGIEVYIATANRGLPLLPARPPWLQVLLLHDLFQWTHADAHASRLKALAYRLIERASLYWSLQRADVIWSPSHYTMQEVSRLFPALQPKLRWLPNAVAALPLPATAQRPQALAAVAPQYWLTVGTRGPRKNLPLLLAAWQGLRRQDVAVPDLVLVGQPEDLPPDSRDQPGLHVFAGIDDALLGALYRHAQCLWHPAFAEGFGLPVVEAMAAGTPVAVARGTALDEITPPQAPRFDPHDLPALQQLMRQLAEQPLQLPRQLWQDFAARFSPPAYADRLLELMDELR